MKRAPKHIRQRKRIFLGCEGPSEQGYGQLLNALAENSDPPTHIDAAPLNPGAGDPLALITRSVQKIRTKESRRAHFEEKFLLMDRDRADDVPGGIDAIVRLAAESQIKIVWQTPCHEALILRHLPNCQNLRPPTNEASNTALSRQWPDYRKPMTSIGLSNRIGLDDVRRAAAVEPGLMILLRVLGIAGA